MNPLLNLYAALTARWTELTGLRNADRGDSPVSTAVIVAKSPPAPSW